MYLDNVFTIISVTALILIIYKNFFKPLKTYKDYIIRAANYELLLQRKKAKNI